MNQTIRNSGGKSAAHSRSGRVFRRSLTPILALLTAMTLVLVVPTAAGAQALPNAVMAEALPEVKTSAKHTPT